MHNWRKPWPVMLDHISLAGALYSRAKRVVLESVLLFKSRLTNYQLEETRQGLQCVGLHGRDTKSRELRSLVWALSHLTPPPLCGWSVFCIVPHRNLGSQINTSITICQGQQFCTEESMSLHDSSTVHGDVVISVSLALSLSQRLPIFLLDTGNKAYYFCLSQ